MSQASLPACVLNLCLELHAGISQAAIHFCMAGRQGQDTLYSSHMDGGQVALLPCVRRLPREALKLEHGAVWRSTGQNGLPLCRCWEEHPAPAGGCHAGLWHSAQHSTAGTAN